MFGVASSHLLGANGQVLAGVGPYISLGYGNSPYPTLDNITTDTINWSQYSTTTTPYNYYNIASGNNVYVRTAITLVGGNVVQYSYDGQHWNNASLILSADQQVDDLIFGNGIFIIVFQSIFPTYPYDYAYSTNGINWTSNYFPNHTSTNTYNSISFGSGYFTAGQTQVPGTASLNTIVKSTDGITWSTSTLPIGVDGWETFSGNNKFFALGFIDPSTYNGYQSSDFGVSWTPLTFSGGTFIPQIYGNGIYISNGKPFDKNANFGSTYYTSTNGYNWMPQSNTYNLIRIIYAHGGFMGINNNGSTAAVSGNGINWLRLTTVAPSIYHINDLAEGF